MLSEDMSMVSLLKVELSRVIAVGKIVGWLVGSEVGFWDGD